MSAGSRDVTERNDSARAASTETAQLRQRFEGAVDTLKRSRRKGLASLYELPWYIVIGPPGSGKTTVLVNSGLSFPLAAEVRQGSAARSRWHTQLRLVVHG